MTAAHGVYTSSFHSPKGFSYQELLLQKEKAKKRASAGGSVAGGDAAASVRDHRHRCGGLADAGKQ
jgi:hypothetical protein